ncbi:outer membrane protein assembly factor BamB [Paractinoplanes atraurantiacus]|uniref:Outer membrane protein assembly factor BamB n=2 Tax=Paractinoplanes atraurantiacus TaxID=1036182 RepID=A0A285F035_9ACTN|nr:outer membrane protein assembly factor BamB [Actinoplanes atraurantiacus]
MVPTPAAASPAQSWPQSGYGPGNTYYNPAETRLNASTITHVKQRWKLATRTSNCDTGVRPVLDGRSLFSNDPGGIGAYDPATGKRRWHVDLPQTTVSRLALADGKLLMLSSECRVPAAFESHLTAFDPARGKRLWSKGLEKFSYDMRIDRGTIVLDSNQNGLASTIAFGVDDGEQRWLRLGDRGDGLVSANGRLLLRKADGGAAAVETRTGKTLWETTNNWYAGGTDPAGTRFYVGSSAGLTAVDAATGKAIWSTKLQVSDVTTDTTHVFFSQYRSATALDARTGRKLYSVHTPSAAGRTSRAGGLLYTPTDDGLVVASAATGVPLKKEIPADRDHPPVIAGGWLYVSDGGVLRAYY